MEIELLKEAFRKLLTYTYFDKNDMVLRHDVAVFAKSIMSQKKEQLVFEKLCAITDGTAPEDLEKLLTKIELCFYPKKIKASDISESSNFITNIPTGQAVIEKLLVKSRFPVELLILDTAWLLRYGINIDKGISDSSYGNRLDLTMNREKIRSGNALFKRYSYQYQNWWRNGVCEANKILQQQKQNVSIISFDITNCYHSIDFDFDEFINDYITKFQDPAISQDPLTGVVRRIYERYWRLVMASDAQPFQGVNKGKHPLPLSLLSAHVLANWYISPLDKYISLSYSDKGLCYYGRYVDDCMIVIPSTLEPISTIRHIQEALPGLIKENNDSIVFSLDLAEINHIECLNHLQSFCIQKEKLYVYHFDCQLNQGSLEQFEEELKERSSEFRFLTDEADKEYGRGLDINTLIEAFDVREEKSRRFNLLEENRYKLSVFFAKLNQRLSRQGKSYKHSDEVDKVFKYFNGSLLIKHYLLWEKIFTAFVLSKNYDYIEKFRDRIKDEIKHLVVVDSIFTEDKRKGLHDIRKALTMHLDGSYLMAISLDGGLSGASSLYLTTFMARSYLYRHPLQEFSDEFVRKGKCTTITKQKLSKKRLGYRWIPYYIKYYDIANTYMLGEYFSPTVYKKSFTAYLKLNKISEIDFRPWEVFLHKDRISKECEFNTATKELPPPDKLIVSLVEIDLKDVPISTMLEKHEEEDNQKINLMRLVLDRITQVNNTNIFVMPELSLPIYELHDFCQYSAKYKRAFVTGMEYVLANDVVFNYVVTCLPIQLFGQKDAVPIIREKNYYAPNEIGEILKRNRKIPTSNGKWHIIYHFRGHVFSNFYCYELTNIKDRAYYRSKVDAIYCPVWNRDTYYFNNISESYSRDIHCYLIMSNVSHYGDTRITQPSSHATMNMLRVKGGNTDSNKVVVLSEKIDVKELRDFQRLALEDQKKKQDDAKKEKKETFKMTPAGYDTGAVDKRQQEFMIPFEK